MNIIVYSPLLMLIYFHFKLIRCNVKPENSNSSNYFQTSLDYSNRYHLFWTIDYEAEIVTLEVRAVRKNIFDWFAFGFSDYGEITDADLCVVWFDKKKRAHFQDTWTDNNSFVFVDQQTNNCKPLRFKQNKNIIRYALQRNFDTCDDKDYIIEDGTTHIVYATGSGPLSRIEGLKLNRYENGFHRIQLLKLLEQTPKLRSSTKIVDILNSEVQVPGVETTYWCRIHQLPAELKQKHHVIQYEAVIQPNNVQLVHHMEVFHCEVASDEDLPEWNGSCFDANKPKTLERCKRVIAAWAMGSGPLIYPKEAGLPIGGYNYSLYVMLEIHYNNPGLKSDWIDSSGVRFYYVSELRQYDAAILEIGLEYTDKNSIPPNQSSFDLSGYCSSECTRSALPSYGITIFASQLHTHLTGIQVWTRHIRGGVELPEINRDNHYSQHFQEIRKLKSRVNVFPGDALINVCRYRTLSRSKITLGGFAITDEMCINYLHYFPKTNLEVCKSSIDTQSLFAYFDFMNKYENQNTSFNETFSNNYKSIDWNVNRARFLNRLYESSPLSMQCNNSNGQRFPGYWNGVPVTPVYSPLKPKLRNCPKM